MQLGEICYNLSCNGEKMSCDGKINVKYLPPTVLEVQSYPFQLHPVSFSMPELQPNLSHSRPMTLLVLSHLFCHQYHLHLC